MPRGSNQPYINFQPTLEEKEILEAFCKAHQQTKTAVLRDLIKNLPDCRLDLSMAESLPRGWNFTYLQKGEVKGFYKGIETVLQVTDNGYKMTPTYAGNTVEEIASFLKTTSPLLAVEKAQEIIDDWHEDGFSEQIIFPETAML